MLKLSFFKFSFRLCFSSPCPLNSMITFWAPSRTIMCPWGFALFCWTQSMKDQSLAGWQRRITNQEENHCGTTWIYRRASHLFTITSCFHQTSTRYAKWWITFFFQGGGELSLLGVQSWCWSCKHLIPDVQCKQTLYLSIHFPWSSHFPQVGIFPECTAAPLDMRTHCKRTSSVKKHLT